MVLRYYDTPDGIIQREPTQEELDREFKMFVSSPNFQMHLNAMAQRKKRVIWMNKLLHLKTEVKKIFQD
jgi:hypothetical protein